LFPMLYIIAFAIFVLSHLVRILGVFQNPFYTSFLIPLLFLSFSAQLFYYSEGTKPQKIVLISYALVILAIRFALTHLIEQLFQFWRPISIFPALVFGSVGLLILSFAWEFMGKMLFCLLMVSVANLSIYPENLGPFAAANSSASYCATVDSYDAIEQ